MCVFVCVCVCVCVFTYVCYTKLCFIIVCLCVGCYVVLNCVVMCVCVVYNTPSIHFLGPAPHVWFPCPSPFDSFHNLFSKCPNKHHHCHICPGPPAPPLFASHPSLPLAHKRSRRQGWMLLLMLLYLEGRGAWPNCCNRLSVRR